ncbi:hypothetical protein [Erythrobacter sp. F6033]|uniref:hypothetical protein n=1 Tax=Erythrobacter sp. F6033 TaxID=2926401 RepID=UPI001FF3E75A|nr:hypothetical protein [Erythrobacter sp. F6033]MCK0127963.1 hypothetical protein [Erythrobacter sp. F6033]
MSIAALLLMLAPAAQDDAPAETSSQSAREASRCDMFPAAVPDSRTYGGASDCYLKDIRAKPLWRDLPDKHIQTMRFTFLHGHLFFFRTVQIETRANGKGRLVLKGENFRMKNRLKNGLIRSRYVPLSVEDMQRIETLVAASGTFDHDIGTWDGDELYLHCQTLDMERANADGYRFSSINIGCNHPAKLMPLVEEVARLAKLKWDQGVYR